MSSFFILPEFKETPSPSLWIHAVSLGEVNTVKALIEELKFRYPTHKIYLSTMTETGFMAGQKLKDVEAFYLPLDLWFLQDRLIKKIKPECMIYVEGDVWPSLSHRLHKAGIRQVVVSAKVSETSLARFKQIRPLIPFFYGCIDLFCVQDQTMADRFLHLGISKDKLQVTGNLKLVLSKDLAIDPKLEENLTDFLTLDPAKKTLVIACTHEGEEKLLLEKLKSEIANYNLIIVPRHPERFSVVEHLLEEMGLNCSVFSHPSKTPKSLFLVDAIGVLIPIYKRADVTILGGSFVPGIGGHNVMEPIFQGCPVIVGFDMAGQKAPLEMMLTQKLGYQCPLEALIETVKNLMQDDTMRYCVGEFKAHKSEILDNTLQCLLTN